MRYSLRLLSAALFISALAACSQPSEAPALSDDLKQDLARVGGGDVQLAGATAPRLDVVSAAERTTGAVPSPTGSAVAKAASTHRGTRTVVKSKRKVTPTIAESPRAATSAPVLTEQTEIAPESRPAAAGRPTAPLPSTQPMPRGGWSTPGQVIRNAPFPINP